MTREYVHLQERAQHWVEAHKDDKPPSMPGRLLLFTNLVRPLAWLCGCRVVGLMDKKREATNEQGG